MNSKERVLRTLNHEEPDRVPIHASFVPQLLRKFQDKYRMDPDDLYLYLGNDIVMVTFGASSGFYKEEAPEYVDDLGITYKNIGVYTEIAKHPLDTNAKVLDFDPPKVDVDIIRDRIKGIVDKYGREYAIAGKISQTLFESSWMLRGLERFLMDLTTNEDLANHLMTKMMEYHLEIGKILVSVGVDIIYTGDDVGTQRGMMISPDMFRKLLKPKYTYLWRELKKINPNIKIAHHTCGNITPIIQDYIEAGLDVLNPLQPKALNIVEVKKRYGKNLSFWGGIDIQETLPFGSSEDVFREVRERIAILGPEGGFILSPAHNIQVDTSIENVESFYKAGKQFGKYPLSSLRAESCLPV